MTDDDRTAQAAPAQDEFRRGLIEAHATLSRLLSEHGVNWKPSPAPGDTAAPKPEIVHAAMQSAPFDGLPYRQARAAISAVASISPLLAIAVKALEETERSDCFMAGGERSAGIIRWAECTACDGRSPESSAMADGMGYKELWAAVKHADDCPVTISTRALAAIRAARPEAAPRTFYELVNAVGPLPMTALATAAQPHPSDTDSSLGVAPDRESGVPSGPSPAAVANPRETTSAAGEGSRQPSDTVRPAREVMHEILLAISPSLRCLHPDHNTDCDLGTAVIERDRRGRP
jgi:hypothetical protein